MVLHRTTIPRRLWLFAELDRWLSDAGELLPVASARLLVGCNRFGDERTKSYRFETRAAVDDQNLVD
jgi:hypothetical protein